MPDPATITPLSAAEVKAIDRAAAVELGLSTLVLMENAGRAAAEVLLAERPRGPIVVLAGPGNNGGDALVMARHLDAVGLQVRCLLLGERSRTTPECATNLAVLERAGIVVDDVPPAVTLEDLTARCAGAEWLVDGLLGIGARGAPRPPVATAIAMMNAAPGRRIAVDLPSGLDADTGETPGGCVRADLTVTFLAPKRGFVQAGAVLGRTVVVSLGLPRLWLARTRAAFAAGRPA
jgi:NAD(P)H-hydrate epimerase